MAGVNRWVRVGRWVVCVCVGWSGAIGEKVIVRTMFFCMRGLFRLRIAFAGCLTQRSKILATQQPVLATDLM